MKSFNIAAQIVDAYNIMKELPEEWKPSIGLRRKQLREQPVFSVIYHLNSKSIFWFDRRKFHITSRIIDILCFFHSQNAESTLLTMSDRSIFWLQVQRVYQARRGLLLCWVSGKIILSRVSPWLAYLSFEITLSLNRLLSYYVLGMQRRNKCIFSRTIGWISQQSWAW